MNILNSQKPTEMEKMIGKRVLDLRIIDKDATNHMIGTLKNMCEERKIQGCPMGLLEGEHVLACKQGTIILKDELRLKNVLYVPKLKCNLISVPQLTNETNCIVQFTNKSCVIQDRTLRTLI